MHADTNLIDVARLSSTPAINTAWTQNNPASDLAPSFTRKPRMLLHVKGKLEVKVRHGDVDLSNKMKSKKRTK